MLTINQLKRILKLNQLLTIRAMRSTSLDSTKRLHELAVHRSMIKDLMIERLEALCSLQ